MGGLPKVFGADMMNLKIVGVQVGDLPSLKLTASFPLKIPMVRRCKFLSGPSATLLSGSV